MDFDPNGHHVYRIERGWRVFFYVLVPPLLLLLVGMPVWEWQRHTGRLLAWLAYSAMPLGFAAFFLYGLAEIIKSRTVIANGVITQAGALSTTSLQLVEIRGFQVDRNYLRFIPTDKRKRPVKISLLTEHVGEIIAWANDYYPSLNRENKKTAAASPVQEALVPAPFAELSGSGRKLAEAQQTARLLNWCSWLTVPWLLFYPEPYTLAISAGLLLPLAAIAAQWLYPGMLRADEPDAAPAPSLGVSLSIPSIGLFVRMLLDAELVSTATIQTWAYPAGGGFALLLLAGGWKQLFGKNGNGGPIIIILIAAVLYGYSAPVAYNVAFDTGRPADYRPVLLRKYINDDELPGFSAVVEPWGPFSDSTTVHVSKAYYHRLRPGNRLRVRLMPGALGIPWFKVQE